MAFKQHDGKNNEEKKRGGKKKRKNWWEGKKLNEVRKMKRNWICFARKISKTDGKQKSNYIIFLIRIKYNTIK